ncbi:MAG: NADH-quinone oxidoreductase subunit L [Firmicutes bacterium]|nr:NADH-quinone oxidoreductase subunit L [Bacillota bacterium]
MDAWPIALAILLPVATALLAYIFRIRAARVLAVVVMAAGLMVSALALAGRGSFTYTPESVLGLPIDTLITILDLALLGYLVWIGLSMRRLSVVLLAGLQLAGLGYLEFWLRGSTPAVLPAEPAMVIDRLAVTMNLIISGVGSLVVLFALPYMDEFERRQKAMKTRQPRFFLFLLLFLGAMNGLVFSNNLLWLYFFWEATTFSSFMLITHTGAREALANGLRALWMNLLGGLAFVLALIFLARNAHIVSLRALAGWPLAGWPGWRGLPPIGSSPDLLLLPMGLLCFAAFTKAAQFPFQTWLTGAMVAPTPVSALLHSSTMVKAAVYLIIRLAPAFRGTTLGILVAVIGGFTFMAASTTAIGQANGKRVLAYSTIANLGLIIAMAGINTPQALSAALLIIIFHAISKALLFICVGTIEHGIRTRDIEEMEGLFYKMPMTTIITVVAMTSMMLPPFGVLIGKWLAIEASVRFPLLLPFVVLGSALTVVFWSKWLGRILTVSYHRKFRLEKLPLLISASMLVLAAAVVVASFGIASVFDFLAAPVVRGQFGIAGVVTPRADLATGMGEFIPWPIFLLIVLVLLAIPISFSRVKPADIRPPYLCGENAGEKPGTSFYSARDEINLTRTGNYYVTGVFGEASINRWAYPIAVGLLLLMIGVIKP